MIFNFNNSYAKLHKVFYHTVLPDNMPQPETLVFNQNLATELELKINNPQQLIDLLNQIPNNKTINPIATAYAGHQFAYFTMLGDGRALLLGEHLTTDHKRFDIQLKGSGRTPYSRGGDGKATLKSMLKEYLFSEALHGLGIPSSRSLAVIATGQTVYRETARQGAVLIRSMEGQIRVGTFEFARYYASTQQLEQLLNYAVKRHYPEIQNGNKAIQLLQSVMSSQIEMLIGWMRTGFVHGVMNTDNTSITGESFDYGPCAFMGIYHPDTFFSSIDQKGRYAFANQPKILKWNLARFAEALLPLIHKNQDHAVKMATETINQFDDCFDQKFQEMMLAKIGIQQPIDGDVELAQDFLRLLKIHRKDFTHSFNYLRLPDFYKNKDFILGAEFVQWLQKWKHRINFNEGKGHAFSIMERYNPFYIPRNYFVEEALNLAVKGDTEKFNSMLQILKMPYWYDSEMDNSLFDPPGFDEHFKTTCGT